MADPNPATSTKVSYWKSSPNSHGTSKSGTSVGFVRTRPAVRLVPFPE